LRRRNEAGKKESLGNFARFFEKNENQKE
jgi:hypothetical protein